MIRIFKVEREQKCSFYCIKGYNLTREPLNNKKLMSYKITHSYNWYKTSEDKFIIKTYYINNIAFTFDELNDIGQNDSEIIKKANQQLTYDPNFFYQKSFYLIDEEAHPLLFDMDLENPQDLPDEDYEFLQ
jgi:hypothetical protein